METWGAQLRRLSSTALSSDERSKLSVRESFSHGQHVFLAISTVGDVKSRLGTEDKTLMKKNESKSVENKAHATSCRFHRLPFHLPGLLRNAERN